MSQENYIAQLLDMEGIEITDLKSTTDQIVISFRLNRRDHVCPACKAVTDQVHDYRVQMVKDLPIQGKRSSLGNIISVGIDAIAAESGLQNVLPCYHTITESQAGLPHTRLRSFQKSSPTKTSHKDWT